MTMGSSIAEGHKEKKFNRPHVEVSAFAVSPEACRTVGGAMYSIAPGQPAGVPQCRLLALTPYLLLMEA